jgi:hypothetical protein
MSALPLNKIIRFLLIAAGLIIVLSVLWNFVDSDYSTFLGKIASALAPAEYKVETHEGTIYFTRQYFIMDVGGKPTHVAVPKNYPSDASIVASAIQFGLLLTVALVAATPGLGWRRRILFSLIAASVTFTLQVLSVVVMAKTFNTIFFVIVSDVFPPLLWAFFFFRYWNRNSSAKEKQPVIAPVQPPKKHTGK